MERREILKQHRARLKLTQREMAERMDTPFQTYRYWELNGKLAREPPRPVVRLAGLLVAIETSSTIESLRRKLG